MPMPGRAGGNGVGTCISIAFPAPLYRGDKRHGAIQIIAPDKQVY